MLAATCVVAPAQEIDRAIAPEQFTSVHVLIKPQPGESPWARIPWLTDLAEARRKSAVENKPLFVWRAGGGEVLGRA
jgi:hypothetical protein